MVKTIISNTSFDDTVCILKEYNEQLIEGGSFFAIIQSEYNNDLDVTHDFFEVIDIGVNLGYEYVNTIVYPTKNFQTVSFKDNVKYVVWLAKNRSKLLFSKDKIREKHIWKDVEWGKRTKNYNSKGKDPGNVWIPTEDDGKAHITNHILLDDDGVIKRLLSMTECVNNDDYLLFNKEHSIKQSDFDKHIKSDDVVEDLLKGIVYFKSSESMMDVQNKSVKVIVTSPPYWNLKDYFKKGQIGQESYFQYISRTKKVWKECFEKLSNDGSLWININIRVNAGDVILIPKDFIASCKSIGFKYKGILIWHKSSGIPTGEHNLVDHHEYVLIFAKSNKFKIDSKVYNTFTDYKNDIINGCAFWNINRKAGSVGKKYIHPAIYPNELVSRIIKITTKPGEYVLDPFLGSGTSLIAALQNGCNFVGYEFNEKFMELMQSRFEEELGAFANIDFRY